LLRFHLVEDFTDRPVPGQLTKLGSEVLLQGLVSALRSALQGGMHVVRDVAYQNVGHACIDACIRAPSQPFVTALADGLPATDAKNGATTANERSRATNDHTPNHRADHPRRHRQRHRHRQRAGRIRPVRNAPGRTGPATSADHDSPHAPPPPSGTNLTAGKVIKLCDPAGPITGSLASNAARTVRNGSFWPRLMAQPAQRPCSEHWPTTRPAGQHQWKSTLCGPCTLVRWRRVLDTEARHKSLPDLLKNAEVVTADGHHPCHTPKPIDDKTMDAVLFPPINQWGQMPFPLEPLSPHSTSRLARQAETGLAHHKVLDADELVATGAAGPPAVEPVPAVPRPVWDWEAANQRKIDAVRQLAPLADALDDIERRIAALIARTNDLELG